MLALKYLLMLVAVLSIAATLTMSGYHFWLIFQFRRNLARGPEGAAAPFGLGPSRLAPGPVRWRLFLGMMAIGCVSLLIANSITVVPSGMGSVRVSQTRGTLPGTLYSGVHFVAPLVEQLQTFDLRDKLFTTGMVEDGAKVNVTSRPDSLDVQSKEGLSMGLAITVRYRLDPRRLDYIQSRLPQPVESEIVPPVVASAWRELAPNYTVREIFSTKREEVRKRAAAVITKKLSADGVIVEEVMLRNIQLPPEYAKGLEDLLLKEQQDDRLTVQTDIQQKEVRIAELEAEAEAARKVKQAEGDAKARVMEAKGEADAMQFTLPLKEKQIEQSRLEAQARKEATIKNAEAEGEAKIIDSKAEFQRRNLLAEAEANRIRVTAAADAERMQGEAKLLNQSPLLINKIIAERLSDKIQVMMVPADGKFFFANEVFKGFGANAAVKGGVDPQAEGGRGH
ncbi:MAG TPA: SPFH domain-containing protein [Acidobacteriaceae bacterium]|nr:SPFH domain-containing protein [Acidobacteriaceae bacterium]